MRKIGEFRGNPIISINEFSLDDVDHKLGIFLGSRDMETFMIIFKAGFEALGMPMIKIPEEERNKNG